MEESMEYPEDLLYTEEHEWARVEEKIVTIGITDFAQKQLGDIVYLDLPSEGDELSQEDTFGVIESVKAVSDLYSPVSGKVVEVNTSLLDSPEIINQDPYGEGWMLRIEIEDEGSDELEELLSAPTYEKLVEAQEGKEDISDDDEEEEKKEKKVKVVDEDEEDEDEDAEEVLKDEDED